MEFLHRFSLFPQFKSNSTVLTNSIRPHSNLAMAGTAPFNPSESFLCSDLIPYSIHSTSSATYDITSSLAFCHSISCFMSRFLNSASNSTWFHSFIVLEFMKCLHLNMFLTMSFSLSIGMSYGSMTEFCLIWLKHLEHI